MNPLLKKALWRCSLPFRNLATRAYAAGPGLEDAIEAARRFAGQGMTATLGYWPGDDDTPRSIAGIYGSAIDALAGEGRNGSISIKAPVLAFDRELIAEVAKRAARAGVGVHFDSRAIDLADRTFEAIADAVRLHPGTGCTLPGRWRRSLRDARRAVDLGVAVRVVKGQWPDPEGPDADLRAGFLAVVDRLAGRACRVAVATHDAPLARQALRRLKDAGTPCELQLLYGLPLRSVIQVAQELGAPVRMYIPYGHSWIPYALSWARKNPRVLGWLLQDALFGRWSYVAK